MVAFIYCNSYHWQYLIVVEAEKESQPNAVDKRKQQTIA
jgi:hypothetical protein